MGQLIDWACSIQDRARAALTPAASATRSGEASASLAALSMPALLNLTANTGPIPSMTSIPDGAPADGTVVRKVGGSGSREVATDMKRSRIAHASAAAPATNPTILASFLITTTQATHSALPLRWPS